MKKIVIVGTTGSGKTTFASKLAKKLKYPHIQLDTLYWKPNWQWAADEEFCAKIESSTKQEKWIVDGNYTHTQCLTWSKADTVIWLDLPYLTTLMQCLQRTIGRIIHKKELWEGTGNKETLSRVISKNSILLWFFKTYKLNKKNYAQKILDTKYSHISFYRFSSHRQMNDFLSSL